MPYLRYERLSSRVVAGSALAIALALAGACDEAGAPSPAPPPVNPPGAPPAPGNPPAQPPGTPPAPPPPGGEVLAEARSQKARDATPGVSEADRRTLAAGNAAFALALYGQIEGDTPTWCSRRPASRPRWR